MSFVDELALAGAEHVDPDLVERYDRKAAFDPTGDIAMLRELGLGSDSTVLDVGPVRGRSL